MATPKSYKIRAFIRYTKSGRVLPSVFYFPRGTQPKGSGWVEVPYDQCCQPTTTTSTTTDAG